MMMKTTIWRNVQSVSVNSRTERTSGIYNDNILIELQIKPRIDFTWKTRFQTQFQTLLKNNWNNRLVRTYGFTMCRKSVYNVCMGLFIEKRQLKHVKRLMTSVFLSIPLCYFHQTWGPNHWTKLSPPCWMNEQQKHEEFFVIFIQNGGYDVTCTLKTLYDTYHWTIK